MKYASPSGPLALRTHADAARSCSCRCGRPGPSIERTNEVRSKDEGSGFHSHSERSASSRASAPGDDMPAEGPEGGAQSHMRRELEKNFDEARVNAHQLRL